MKTEDLYLKYAEVIKMCEGTKVKPWEGVRQPETRENRHPDFTMPPNCYEFMVAVLEDKPVFVGDKLFIKDGHWITVEEDTYVDINHMSWNENVIPKHCGISANGYADIDGTYKLNVGNWTFHYHTAADIDKAFAAIKELLK